MEDMYFKGSSGKDAEGATAIGGDVFIFDSAWTEKSLSLFFLPLFTNFKVWSYSLYSTKELTISSSWLISSLSREPTAAGVCKVPGPCYCQKPCACPGSGLSPEAMLVFDGHAAAGPIPIWVVYNITQGHGDVRAQAEVKDRVWVHGPTATEACVVAHYTIKGHLDIHGLGQPLKPCWYAGVMLLPGMVILIWVACAIIWSHADIWAWAAAEGHVWALDPTTAVICDDVHGLCYQWRPCGCLGCVPSSKATLVSEAHAAAGAILIIVAWTLAEGHICVCGPTAVGVCVDVYDPCFHHGPWENWSLWPGHPKTVSAPVGPSSRYLSPLLEELALVESGELALNFGGPVRTASDILAHHQHHKSGKTSCSFTDLSIIIGNSDFIKSIVKGISLLNFKDAQGSKG